MSIRLLIADDHEIVRRGLKSLLRDTDIEIVGEAATGDMALRLAKKRNPDVILLDVRMPGRDGIWTLANLKADLPKLPVLILSAYDNPAFVAQAVALAASGYIIKSAPRRELLRAIRTAAAGKTTWTRDELRRAASALVAPRRSADVEVSLTKRENEVLTQLVQGATYGEIAKSLDLKIHSVRDDMKRILRKIGVEDCTQAAIWAMRKGLV
jgi:DNA-binding NarL/FixJ family response regulator